jgi:hypothetical protein
MSNQDIFQFMQQLQGLSVTVSSILSDGKDYIIGKSSIDDLSAVPLVDASPGSGDAEQASVARRAFEIPICNVSVSYATGRSSPYWRRFHRCVPGRSPHVCIATSDAPSASSTSSLAISALVGYDDSLDFIPPDAWQLKPGVFSVVDSLMSSFDRDGLNRRILVLRPTPVGLDGLGHHTRKHPSRRAAYDAKR